jgi:N-acetyltransferase 10
LYYWAVDFFYGGGGEKNAKKKTTTNACFSLSLSTPPPKMPKKTRQKNKNKKSHRKKRMKQLKKLAQRGLLDPEREDPFALFVASTPIRYCYYSEAQNVLGQTYSCCVLQDFEGLTPNLLARTVETVEGGGLVILLVSTLTSLKQLYTVSS